jgi:hypothetical protein
MRNALIAVGLLITIVGVRAGTPQPTQNFSGKWTVDPAAERALQASPKVKLANGSMVPANAAPSFGHDFTARHDAKTLVIARTLKGNPYIVTYNLDGSDNQNTEGGLQTVSKVNWQEGALIIVTHMLNAARTPENQLKRLVKSQADGTLLVQNWIGLEQRPDTVYRRVEK